MGLFAKALEGLAQAGRLLAGPIARASRLSLALRLAGLFLVLVQTVLTARLLGPSGYGIVAWVIAIAHIAAVVAAFGFGSLAVREIPTRLAADGGAGLTAQMRFALVVTLGLSVIAGSTMAIVLGLQHAGGVAVGGLMVMPLALIILFRGWAQGFGRVAPAQVPGEIVRPAVMVAILCGAWITGRIIISAEYLFAATVAGVIGAAVGILWLWSSNLHSLPTSHDLTDRRASIAAAFPLLALGLCGVLQGEINTLLLGSIAGARETGLFQPIARLAPLLMLPVEAAGMRYAPRIAELWQRGEYGRVRSITRTFTWTTTVLTLLIGMAIAGTGRWLLLAFGTQFVEVAPLLWIIAVAQVFNAACGPVGMLLIMSGRSSAALAGQAAGLGANFALSVILIPTHGVLGATIAMAVGIIVWNLVMLAFVLNGLHFNPTITSIRTAEAPKR